jgi:hypothetical protein
VTHFLCPHLGGYENKSSMSVCIYVVFLYNGMSSEFEVRTSELETQ